MPPNQSSNKCTGVLNEADAETTDGGLDKNVVQFKHAHDRNFKLVWESIIVIGLFHLGAVYGVFLMITSARIYTGIFSTYYIDIEVCFKEFSRDWRL